MKNLFILFAAVVLTANVFAQAPQKMSYQAVIRNSSNAIVSSTAVGMQISILQTTASGTAVYVETQTPTTNANGLVSIEIGAGTAVTGTFAGIDWSAGPYFIKTETDPAGGTSYSITGTSQLLSVPFALSAAGIANPRGVVIPKLTAAQITAIANPETGSMVFNTTTNRFQGYRTAINDIVVGVNNNSEPETPTTFVANDIIVQTYTISNDKSGTGGLSLILSGPQPPVLIDGNMTLRFYSGTYGGTSSQLTSTSLALYALNSSLSSFSGINNLQLPVGPGYFTLTLDNSASLKLFVANNSTTISTSVGTFPNQTTTGSNAEAFYLNGTLQTGKCLKFNLRYNSSVSTTNWINF